MHRSPEGGGEVALDRLGSRARPGALWWDTGAPSGLWAISLRNWRWGDRLGENLRGLCAPGWAGPSCPQLLTGQSNLLAGNEQATLDRFEHSLSDVLWHHVGRHDPVHDALGPSQQSSAVSGHTSHRWLG